MNDGIARHLRKKVQRWEGEGMLMMKSDVVGGPSVAGDNLVHC
jgi:hypothetical protein